MKKIFDSHMNCIRSVLQEISARYQYKKRLLDIGCGDGTRTVIFDSFQRGLTGIDRMDWLSGSVREKLDFRKEDFMEGKLSMKDGSFDMAISIDVIEHLRDPAPMLTEVHRVLQEGGIFIISTPNRNRLFGFFLQLFGVRKFPYYPNKDTAESDPYSAHVVEYTFSELKTLVKENGFKVIRGHKIFYGVTSGYGLTTFFSAPLFHNIVLECKKL